MNDTNEEQPIREQVLHSIKSGRVAMKPRWRFVLKTSLFAIGSVIVFLAVLYLTTFVLFMLRRSGVWFAPNLSSNGWQSFLLGVPWILVGAVILFMVILELLVKHYAFAYRQPLLYSVAGIIIIVGLGSFIVDQAHIHGKFSRFVEDHHVPFARDFYHGFGRSHFEDILTGQITEMETRGFLMNDAVEGETFTIIITPRTRLPLGAGFIVGDEVVVFGPRGDHTVEAFGIQKIESEE